MKIGEIESNELHHLLKLSSPYFTSFKHANFFPSISPPVFLTYLTHPKRSTLLIITEAKLNGVACFLFIRPQGQIGS